MSRQRFCVLTRRDAAPRVNYWNTGFYNPENIWEEFTDLSFCSADVCIGEDKHEDVVTEWLTLVKSNDPEVFPIHLGLENNAKEMIPKKRDFYALF